MKFDTTNSAYVVSNNNFTIQKTSGNSNWSNERIIPLIADKSVTKTIEITIDVAATYYMLGIKRSDIGITNYPGGHLHSYGYNSQNGQKYNNSTNSSYGVTWGVGDTIKISYNPDTGDLEFFVNDSSQGVAFTGITGDYYFSYATYNTGTKATIDHSVIGKLFDFNYGQILGTRFGIVYDNTPIVGKLFRILCGSAPIRGKRFSIKYDQARVVGKFFRVFYDSSVAIGKNWIAKYNQQDGIVGKLWEAVYESRNTNPVGKLWNAVYQSTLTGYNEEEVNVFISVGGQQVESITSISITGGIDKFLWEVDIELKDEWEVNLLDQFENVTLNYFGTEYSLIVVNRGKSEEVSDNYELKWEIKLASPTYKLSESYAVPVTKTWANGTSAKDIVQEMCDLYSVTLDWQFPEYIIGELSAERQSPYDIIKTIIDVAGALIQTDYDGSLVISKQYNKIPLDGVVADYNITGLDINSISESADDPVKRPNYVIVSNESEETAAEISLQHEESDRTDGGKDIKAWAEPWAEVTVEPNASVTEVSLIPGGIETEEKEEWLQFVDGESSSTKPVYSDFELIEYRGADPGTISWQEDSKNLTASGGKEYYCKVKYNWRYYGFAYYSSTGEDYQVIQTD